MDHEEVLEGRHPGKGARRPVPGHVFAGQEVSDVAICPPEVQVGPAFALQWRRLWISPTSCSGTGVEHLLRTEQLVPLRAAMRPVSIQRTVVRASERVEKLAVLLRLSPSGWATAPRRPNERTHDRRRLRHTARCSPVDPPLPVDSDRRRRRRRCPEPIAVEQAVPPVPAVILRHAPGLHAQPPGILIDDVDDQGPFQKVCCHSNCSGDRAHTAVSDCRLHFGTTATP